MSQPQNKGMVTNSAGKFVQTPVVSQHDMNTFESSKRGRFVLACRASSYIFPDGDVAKRVDSRIVVPSAGIPIPKALVDAAGKQLTSTPEQIVAENAKALAEHQKALTGTATPIVAPPASTPPVTKTK